MNFELIDLIRIVKQRLIWVVLIVIVSVSLTGWISFFILPLKYEVKTTLLVQPQNEGNKISYNDLITNEKLVSTYGEIIKSKKIAKDVIQRLKLNLSVNELLSKVRTQVAKDSLLTEIIVTDTSPDRAVDIANSFAHSFQVNLPDILKVENISILDKATNESSMIPVSPKPYLNMTIVFFLTISISIGLALLFDMLDKTVQTEDNIEKKINLPILGIIPKFPRKKVENKIKKQKYMDEQASAPYLRLKEEYQRNKEEQKVINLRNANKEPSNSLRSARTGQLIVKENDIYYLNYPNSQVAESYRTLRTNIKYMDYQQDIRTLLVTSSVTQEGKTTIVANLAVAFAQEGKKVLLMDCDLRSPSLHRLFHVSNLHGLTSLLEEEIDNKNYIFSTEVENLHILPSGPIPTNPAELLGKKMMIELMEKLKENYDLILIDSPPILSVTDGQILAKISDTVLLVIKSKMTKYDELLKTKHLLYHVHANLIGTVLNSKKIKSNQYYYHQKK